MIDWLRRGMVDPEIEIAGTTLPIAVRRHSRARRLTMRMAPDNSEIRITIPSWARTQDALVFVEARKDWLAEQLAKAPECAPVEAGGTFRYRGEEVRIDWRKGARRKPELDGGSLTLGGPHDTLSRRIQRWLESEALALLREDLAFYCARAGQDVPDLRLSRAQRRWGSCSGKRCIRVNWRLVQAPDPVRRSVVAHEVAHLQHFDHSPAFHAMLAAIYDDDLPAADAWLKAQGRSLYAAFG